MLRSHLGHLVAVLASLLIHLIVGLVIILWPSLPEFHWKSVERERETGGRFEIVALSQEELRQLRQVGVRGGQTEGFSEPLPQGNDPSEVPDHRDQSPPPPPPAGSEDFIPHDRLGFSSLSPNNQQVEHEQLPKPERLEPEQTREGQTEVRLRSLQDRQAPDNAARIARQQEQIQGNILRELGASPQAAEAIRRAGFNVQFDPPEGVEEDELNTVEMIFYSFQRRTFYNYVTNFVTSYQRMLFSKPHTRRLLERESHHLIGRVEFDQSGYVNSLRLVRKTQHQDINLMFEETLKNLNLPNPPEALLNAQGRLVIHFHLRIN